MGKYPARHNHGKESTAAQYITDIICEKKAKEDLPDKYWQIPKWKVFYQQQIIAANGLLKVYNEVAIIRALLSKEAWNIYSLRAPHLVPLIQSEEAKLNVETKKSELKLADTKSKPKQHKVKPNVIDQLKDLE